MLHTKHKVKARPHHSCSITLLFTYNTERIVFPRGTQDRGGFNANQWLPCKETSHNVLLQQRELKLWSLCHLQEAWRDGHVPLRCGRSIIRRRLIAAADHLQKVVDIMEAAGRERELWSNYLREGLRMCLTF